LGCDDAPDRVRQLLDQNPALANRVPPYSTYYSGLPLRSAAGGGHLEVVRLLLERGADPNEPEPGVAPHGGALHAAISGRHYEIVRLLLEHGADANAAVESSGNCFWIAKHTGAPQEVQDLIAAHGGVATVAMVCYDGDLETLAAMLQADPQLHFDEESLRNVIENGHRACMELILRHRPEILKGLAARRVDTPELAHWLMERGLDPNRGDWLGVTPLHYCAGLGRIDMAAAYVDQGADLDAVDTDSSSTPLGWAARHGHRDMVEWLLKRGAKPHLPAEEPWAQPAAWARRRHHAEILQLLG
jgi:ankyrin repeat protein